MSLGTRAMQASYAELQATGHNIANANTPGYSRQSVALATSGGQYQGAGFFGKGVDVATVNRAHDEFLTREAAASQSLASADSARLGQLQQLEKIFGTGEAGLGYAAGQMLNAFADVAAHPQDSAARQVVLARADEVAARFRAAGSSLDSLQSGVTQELKNSIDAVNSMARSVADLNRQIAAVRGVGHAPNDLLDQRDQLVAEIGKYVQVTPVSADDGSQSLFIGGGQRLVLGGDALPLAALPDPYDIAQVRLGVRDSGIARLVPESLVVGGSIAGLLRFQNEALRDARNSLGQLAAALSGSVNQQQALGLDLRTPAGRGAPIFADGAPRVLPANTNAKDAAGNFVASYIGPGGARVSSVGMTVTNPSELLASDYELRAGAAAGSYQLTRLSDGLVRSVTSGSVVDGFRIDVAAPAPGANDRYLLQPLATAASDLQRVLSDPKGIAAASLVTATLAAANKGTASVASLTTVSPAIDTSLKAGITFTSDSGDYDWELRDSASNALVSSGSGTWVAGTPIKLNGWELQLAGVPRDGDTASVEPTAFPAANNGNALALLGLRDAGRVGQVALGGGGVAPGDTFTDAYANALSRVGVRVQNAQSAASLSGAVASQAEGRRADTAGVNLDEEAARLIQFQQSYQAAAKMLQVAQSVFDTLLQVTSR